MVKKLSKTGRTKFEIENIDYGILLEALDHYKDHISDITFPDNTIMTKGFVLGRVESLKKTFKVGE